MAKGLAQIGDVISEGTDHGVAYRSVGFVSTLLECGAHADPGPLTQ